MHAHARWLLAQRMTDTACHVWRAQRCEPAEVSAVLCHPWRAHSSCWRRAAASSAAAALSMRAAASLRCSRAARSPAAAAAAASPSSRPSRVCSSPARLHRWGPSHAAGSAHCTSQPARTNQRLHGMLRKTDCNCNRGWEHRRSAANSARPPAAAASARAARPASAAAAACAAPSRRRAAAASRCVHASCSCAAHLRLALAPGS